MAAVMAAAASRTRIIAFVNCSASRRQAGLAARSSSSFGPWVIRRRRASLGSRPRSASEPRAETTSGASIAHGLGTRSTSATCKVCTPEDPPAAGSTLMLSVPVRRTWRGRGDVGRYDPEPRRRDAPGGSADRTDRPYRPSRIRRSGPSSTKPDHPSVGLGSASTAPADRSWFRRRRDGRPVCVARRSTIDRCRRPRIHTRQGRTASFDRSSSVRTMGWFPTSPW